jgi:predicted permease
MISKNIFSGIGFFLLHHGKRRRNIIIIGGSLLAIGFIGMITTGSLVIQDTANNNLTPQGYPKTAIMGISIYSFEYAFLFITILGFFLFAGGMVGMDSKKKLK